MTTAPLAGTSLDSARAQEALEDLIARHDIPGAGFAALRDGEVVATAAAGVANLDTGLRVTDGTIWQPGSIGKTYCTVLVMQLVDEGLVDLDRPVSGYIPGLRFADETATRTVTVRQLLSHTSGIDGDRIDETGALFGRSDDAVQRYVASLADLDQIVEPGRLWSYCNAGYIVLGRLVEVIRGATYESVLREKLLEPAGLGNTFCFPEEVVARNTAVGHMPSPDGTLKVAPIWVMGRSGGPAGVVPYASMTDLVRFADILVRGGIAADGTRILSAESVAEMQRPHAECPERELLGGHWGLGLLAKLDPGPAVYGHDGNTLGQTAAMRYVPERNLAFALITNRHQTNMLFAELCNAIVDDWAGITTARQRKPVEGMQVDASERFTGTYANVAAEIPVALSDGALSMELRPRRALAEPLDLTPFPLRPLDDATFLARIDIVDDDLQVAFLEPDAGGRPRYLHFGGRLYRRTA